MEIPKKYNPVEREEKWYKYWMDKGYFYSQPDDREPYTIVIPPPNVTGVLHMGHMLNNTIQDILVRRARMQGKNACWVPGTDHASIATEAKVVAHLEQKGIKKSALSREEFLKHAWEWKEKNGGIILEQLKKLGASCDWKRTKFTMDDDLYRSVIKVFIDLYNKGKIYRGTRMVNWDPQAQTAVSDEEVNYKEVQSKLYHVRYKIDGKDDWLTIATTRPETILGDTAVCINPKDERYLHLKGEKIIIPLVDRKVPLIEDEYVDMEFGTGALKITPAHDENDYAIGLKHELETIDIFNDDATLNEKAVLFTGKDRLEAREMIIKKLEEEGYLVKTEDYTNKIGYSERTDAIIEPRLSQQWFVKMKALAEPALENVMNNNIRFYPAKFKNTYKHWMENIKDWCISRQLWWGQRIPVYYEPGGEFVVAESKEEALRLFNEKSGFGGKLQLNDIKQDEDVLDTWFSSWLWPITVFNGINDSGNNDYKYYYPTDDLVTAPEIMFFWVARMIMAGYEYNGEKPFKNVYYTGIVRDNQRRKMSKSLGNSPDPLDLIKKFGADGVRFGMLLCSPAGNDLLFEESLPQQGRNFSNKIWNAFRLVKTWETDPNAKPQKASTEAAKWFNEKIKQTRNKIDAAYSNYRLSNALMELYRLFHDDYCACYLEAIKPEYQQPIDEETYQKAIEFFELLLQMLHPFMPFITEEIWHLIRERNENDDIIVSQLFKPADEDHQTIQQFETAIEIISAVRNIRSEKNLNKKDHIELWVNKQSAFKTDFMNMIKKLAYLSDIKETTEKPDIAATFIVKTYEFYVPLGDMLNIEEEINKLQKELEHNRSFLDSVLKKLNNESFTQNAPEHVVNMERKKEADARVKIKTIEERIASLKP